MIEPDGGQVIDRDAEAELFRELLQLKDQRRLFLISDGEQRGKTTLLRKLKYQCDWDTPRIPCALVKLDELPDNHHYALIEAIYDELETAGVEFPQFQLNRDAIRLRNPEPFAARGSAFDFLNGIFDGHRIQCPHSRRSRPFKLSVLNLIGNIDALAIV